MSERIYISHASSDRDLVRSFVAALEDALDIPEGEIRCASLPGYKLRSAAQSSNELREELAGSELMIGIVTPLSLESGRVMFELGAGWATGKWTIPIIAGADYDALPSVLKESNATDASSYDELEQLLREIAERLNIPAPDFDHAADALDELVAEAESYYDDEDVEDDDEDDDEDEQDIEEVRA